MSKFKTRVEMAVRILQKEGEITVTRLAYLLDVDVATARAILKAAAEIFPEVKYFRGKAVYDSGEQGNE